MGGVRQSIDPSSPRAKVPRAPEVARPEAIASVPTLRAAPAADAGPLPAFHVVNPAGEEAGGGDGVGEFEVGGGGSHRWIATRAWVARTLTRQAG